MKIAYYTTILATLALLTGCELGEEDEFSAKHNQGKNCLNCHSFTSGVTLYTKLHGANYAVSDVARSYSIQLKLETGKILKYKKGNGYGNWLYKGDQGAIDDFIPQVVDSSGNVVNQSKYPHSVGRLACNRCHTQEGQSGAPGRVVNYELNQTNY